MDNTAGGNKMKLTSIKNKVMKALGMTALAGAALAVAAPAAQAQRVYFGLRYGHPVYVAPAPPVVYAPGYGYGAYYGPHYRAWVAPHRYDRHR
jgi:hypothetical protein